MKFGLKQRDMDNIRLALKKFPEIEEAIIFGSRAMGNYKNGSDIDISIKGNNISHRTLARLNSLLEEELPIPFFFDIVDYAKISSDKLIAHIDRVGIVFYEKYINEL
ncbi:nucleotidyltransferase domain-containing protein [Candidatus Marithrix sp. Canyon 246]|uniref:nucleotidyltransferase domain-containing protein n=1 Tax=Candidatus Marithrix sp. Canyon 246 TaxID=1827136 RepID=UPI00084A276B|nr:nucleotidyltransferase domain-containing protein [Candidatus Marithrix sp. Canyon 246]